MGNNNSSSTTPMNSIPEDRTPIPFPQGRGMVDVAFSPDTRAQMGSPPPQKPVPSVFRWEGGAQQNVYVCGDWDNFSSKRVLVRSDSAHTLIMDLPPGQHRYFFEVDGRRCIDPEKPTSSTASSVVLSPSSSSGTTYNVVTAERVGEFAVNSSSEGPEASSPPGDYGQDIREPPVNPARAKRRGNPNDPPMLPPHLLRALLNTQPPSGNPLLLPLPHHVMLNHLYVNKSREKEGVCIYGVTCRYRSKYVTTVLYKPQ